MLDGIISTIEGLIPVQSIIDSGYDAINNLGIIEQVIAFLVLGVIMIIGTIGLVKKLSKLLIVFAILGGLYYLYSAGFLDGIIG
jgi:glucan phosphoethanolaminetransferase (alkaline phosphatase superfamily)